MLRALAVFVLLGASGFAATFSGPAGVYYLGDGTNIFKVQGLNLLSQWAIQNQDLPLAVDSNMRTTGRVIGQQGSLYDLNGTYVGTNYPNSGYASSGMEIWDGTTDRAHNYTLSTVCPNCGADSSVIRTDLDWSNPVVLFSLGPAYNSLGISYDATDDTLWISNWDGGTSISHYTLNGTLLGQFSAGFGEIGALAVDPVDNTLWATAFGSSTLFQFDKSGTLLQSGTIAGLHASTMWSGEIIDSAVSPLPEPETWPLLTGLAAIAICRRYRRAWN